MGQRCGLHTQNCIYTSDYPASEHMKFVCAVNVYVSSTVVAPACHLVILSSWCSNKDLESDLLVTLNLIYIDLFSGGKRPLRPKRTIQLTSSGKKVPLLSWLNM